MGVDQLTTGGSSGIKYIQSSKPSYDQDEFWLDTETGVLYAAYNNEWKPTDPTTVTETTESFSETDVKITHNNTTVDSSSGSVHLGRAIIDDFEENDTSSVKNADWSGWSTEGGSGVFEAQSNTVISGNYSVKEVASGEFRQESITHDSSTTEDIKFTLRINSDTGNGSDSSGVRFKNSNGNSFGDIKFFDGSSNVEFAGTEIKPSWSVDTNYTVEMVWDFGNNQADVTIDDNTTTGIGFINSASGVAEIWCQNFTNDSGSTRECYFDDIEYKSGDTSGDVLIAWSSGVPSDISSWDIVTFNTTEDGETVTVDVEDSNGNTLHSSLSESDTPYDISDVDTTKDVKLRANISRNDVANLPRIDFAGRRWVQ